MVSLLTSFITRLLTSIRRFSGDESFVSDGNSLDAGSGLGVVIEGKKAPSSSHSPSRL